MENWENPEVQPLSEDWYVCRRCNTAYPESVYDEHVKTCTGSGSNTTHPQS